MGACVCGCNLFYNLSCENPFSFFYFFIAAHCCILIQSNAVYIGLHFRKFKYPKEKKTKQKHLRYHYLSRMLKFLFFLYPKFSLWAKIELLELIQQEFTICIILRLYLSESVCVVFVRSIFTYILLSCYCFCSNAFFFYTSTLILTLGTSWPNVSYATNPRIAEIAVDWMVWITRTWLAIFNQFNYETYGSFLMSSRLPAKSLTMLGKKPNKCRCFSAVELRITRIWIRAFSSNFIISYCQLSSVTQNRIEYLH